MFGPQHVVRIETVPTGERIIRGTGFFLQSQALLTALHVVAQVGPDGVVHPYENITLTISSEPQSPLTLLQPNIIAYNIPQDWAILATPSAPGCHVLLPAPTVRPGDAWNTFGFPGEDHGRAIHGTVTMTNAPRLARIGYEALPVDAIQLFSHEAAAGRPQDVRGFSGAPAVNSDGEVFGILCCAPADSIGNSEGGTLLASPIAGPVEALQQEHTSLGLATGTPSETTPPNDHIAPWKPRPLRFKAKQDIPDHLALAYLNGQYTQAIQYADEELTRSTWRHDVLLATKAEALLAMGNREDASITYLDVASQFNTTDAEHWVYKIRSHIIVGWAARARTLAAEALELLPSNIDIWMAHAWAYASDGSGPRAYFDSLPDNRRNDPDVIDAIVQMAHRDGRWSDILYISEATQPHITASLPMMFSVARARLGLLPVLIGQGLPTNLENEVMEILVTLQQIEDAAKGMPEHNDIRLEANLHTIDCQYGLGQRDEAAATAIAIQMDFPGHWAALRAKYMQIMRDGHAHQAIMWIERVVPLADADNRPIVLKDLAVAQLCAADGSNRVLLEECDKTASEAQRILGPDNVDFLREALLEIRVAANTQLKRHDAALEIARSDRTCDYVFRSAVELDLLARSGKTTEALDVYLAKQSTLRAELGKSPAPTRRRLAMALCELKRYDDALTIFEDSPETGFFSSEEISAMAHCLYSTARIEQLWTTATNYQTLNGHHHDLSRIIIASLSPLDPLRVLGFFAAKDESSFYEDWQTCCSLMDLSIAYGSSFQLSLQGVIHLAAVVPTGLASAVAKQIFATGGMNKAIRFLLAHLAEHSNSSDAKLAYIFGLTELNRMAPAAFLDEAPSTGDVFRITRNDNDLYYSIRTPSVLGHLVVTPDEGSEARAIIDSHISGTPRPRTEAGGTSVATITFCEFVAFRISEQLNALVRGVSRENVRVIESLDELEEELRGQTENAAADHLAFKAALAATGDIYSAIKSTGFSISVLQAMATVWHDRGLALKPGRNLVDTEWARPDTLVLVDIMPFLNFSIFVGRQDLLGHLGCSFGASPVFFQLLRRSRALVEYLSHERLASNGGHLTILPSRPPDARLRLDPHHAREFLSIVPSVAIITAGQTMQIYERLGTAAEAVCVGIAEKNAGRDVVLWSDSIAQRTVALEHGLRSITTGDLLTRCTSLTLLSDVESLRIRMEMLSVGYHGVDLQDADANAIVFEIWGGKGEKLLSDLFRGYRRHGVDFKAVVRWCAVLALKLAPISEGVFSDGGLGTLANHIRSLSVHVDSLAHHVPSQSFALQVIEAMLKLGADKRAVLAFKEMLGLRSH